MQGPSYLFIIVLDGHRRGADLRSPAAGDRDRAGTRRRARRESAHAVPPRHAGTRQRGGRLDRQGPGGALRRGRPDHELPRWGDGAPGGCRGADRTVRQARAARRRLGVLRRTRSGGPDGDGPGATRAIRADRPWSPLVRRGAPAPGVSRSAVRAQPSARARRPRGPAPLDGGPAAPRSRASRRRPARGSADRGRGARASPRAAAVADGGRARRVRSRRRAPARGRRAGVFGGRRAAEVRLHGAGAESADREVLPPLDASRSARRWADLLLCEHLALETLRAGGVAAARSAYVELDGRAYLEVERFDRTAHGRVAVVSGTTVDAEFVGSGAWVALAEGLVGQQRLSREGLDGVRLLHLFGGLIGNTDMHLGNIAFFTDDYATFRLAPAYDMLPMALRPTTHGELPKVEPALPMPGDEAWARAADLAEALHARMREVLVDVDVRAFAERSLAKLGALRRVARLTGASPRG
ncbi:MAG: HipA domain-containing protein [Myxococcales bacterium]|nr:HipA domain-containing protein [Myxococcales bacterium]